MASLYAQYIRERTGDEIIEVPEGFATYRYLNNDKTVYIVDIFVLPEHRNKQIASALADMVVVEAKKNGAVELIGTIVPSLKNSTISAGVLIAYGMSLNSSGNDVIILRKEI